MAVRTRFASPREGGIVVEGARELRRDLKAVDAALPRAMRLVNLKAAEIVASEARHRVKVGPDKGGHIRDTIKARATTTRAMVQVGDAARPYAFPLEFGWPSRGIRARPFIYPSIAAKGEEIIDRYGDLIEEVYRRAFPQRVL